MVEAISMLIWQLNLRSRIRKEKEFSAPGNNDGCWNFCEGSIKKPFQAEQEKPDLKKSQC
ncbi:unnamed protein product [Notodromas monacha]|uniref:Uncharacterized protein n=1 Tax=Notodromas monacha TaxID=399045 RepID=A0A7R9GEN6_9CRUS|nr:unnamed protein product [Notodromas monacha]CAG0919929.1 unnamed protein product [Notodromas monacha]